MRRSLAAFVCTAGVALLGCDTAGPLETSTSPLTVQAAATPGTGDPVIDEQLRRLNNEAVTCATNGELDRRTASTIALLTAVLRFTPSPQQKLEALLGAIQLQIEHAQRKGTVSDACAERLLATIDEIAA